MEQKYKERISYFSLLFICCTIYHHYLLSVMSWLGFNVKFVIGLTKLREEPVTVPGVYVNVAVFVYYIQ